MIALALLAGLGSFSTDLRPSLGPARDQGHERNTCSAFAATGLAEALLAESTGARRDLSEAWTYRMGRTRALDSPFLRKMYGSFDGLAGFLAVRGLKYGVVDEIQWPYDSASPGAGVSACGGHGAPELCFSGVPPAGLVAEDLGFVEERVDRARIGDFIERERRPVVFNLMWYFAAARLDGRLRLPTATEVNACRAQGSGCAGHVVLFVGYDRARDVLLFRNSWGEGWGEKGYGSLPARYLEDHCEVCATLGSVGSMSPEERDFVLEAADGASGRIAR